MVGYRRRARRGIGRRRVPARAALRASTPTTCSTSCAARRCSGRSAASPPSTAPRCATCCSRSRASRRPSAASSRSTSTPSSSIGTAARSRSTRWWRSAATVSRLDPFFDPRGIIVAGASRTPGQVRVRRRCTTSSRCGYAGPCSAMNLEGGEVLGLPVATSVDDLPDDVADLVFVCTPPGANPELLRACARKGVRAAFVATAGYGEAGADGRQGPGRAGRRSRTSSGCCSRVPTARASCRHPSALCAQIVAPYPPPGRIGIASQSGNFVSSFLNLSIQSGVGVSRAVSAGNAAAVTVADYLEYFADDPATAVSLAYVEAVSDGRAFYDAGPHARTHPPAARRAARAARPRAGSRAAASHTGALASDDRVFAGMCRQAGRSRRPRPSRRRSRPRRRSRRSRSRAGPSVAVRHHRRRLGCGRPPTRSAGPSSPSLSLPDDLRAAIDEEPAAALEPQQPDRPRGVRDARHHARRCSSWWPATPTSTR